MSVFGLEEKIKSDNPDLDYDNNYRVLNQLNQSGQK